jgi:hypothetical protein
MRFTCGGRAGALGTCHDLVNVLRLSKAFRLSEAAAIGPLLSWWHTAETEAHDPRSGSADSLRSGALAAESENAVK